MSGDLLLFCLYLLAGPAAWLLFGFFMLVGRERMMLLQSLRCPLPDLPPLVSILIPAKDEGRRIRECLQSALDQDYPNFEVIAVNDRSADETGTVMEEMARVRRQTQDMERSKSGPWHAVLLPGAAPVPRLRVVHIAEGSLPEGWTGKCNALHLAVQQAQGEYLLFVDSDVILQPNALWATVALAVDRRYDLVSLLPRLEGHSFWESLIVPLAGGALSMLHVIALTNAKRSRIGFANGQFMLFRRSAYDLIGGHEAVRNQYCEDIEMARLLKSRGFRPRIAWGRDLASVRMYSSLGAIFAGWSRIFFAGALGRPARLIAAVLFIVVCVLSLYPAMGWGIREAVAPVGNVGVVWWLGAAAVHGILMTALVALLYAWTGNPRRYVLALPVGATMLGGIFLRAIHMCTTGRVEWRGTRYSHSINVTDNP